MRGMYEDAYVRNNAGDQGEPGHAVIPGPKGFSVPGPIGVPLFCQTF